MNSFYGGQQGKSFKVSKIFKDKVAMVEDLNLRWQSPIGVGEIVFISYGMPNVRMFEGTAFAGSTLPEVGGDTAPLRNINNRFSMMKIGDNYKDTTRQNVYFILKTIQQASGSDRTQDFYTFTYLTEPTYPGYYKQIDLEAYGKTYNSTLWQKIYRESSDAGENELDGLEVYLLNQDYGFGYKLLASLTGSTPFISVANAEVLAPAANPSVSIDTSDIDAPILKFGLPRMVDFFYGTALALPQDYDVVPGTSWLEGMMLGDIYVNNDFGYIYTLTSISTSAYHFKYEGHLAAPAYADLEEKNPFKRVEGQWVANDISVERQNRSGNYYYHFGMLKQPIFKMDNVTWVGPKEYETGAIPQPTCNPSSATDYSVKFTIPKGARIYAETEAEIDYESPSIGDIWINTGTSEMYEYRKNAITHLPEWVATGFSIKGDSLKIVANADLSHSDSPTTEKQVTFWPDQVALVGAWIEAKFPEIMENWSTQDLVSINWTDCGDKNGLYWYNKNSTGWHYNYLSGAASILENSRVSESETEKLNNKTYTAGYINGLIKDDPSGTNKHFFTYSQYATDAKFDVVDNKISWGTFDATGRHDVEGQT